jgi:hypothetical protein
VTRRFKINSDGCAFGIGFTPFHRQQGRAAKIFSHDQRLPVTQFAEGRQEELDIGFGGLYGLLIKVMNIGRVGHMASFFVFWAHNSVIFRILLFGRCDGRQW